MKHYSLFLIFLLAIPIALQDCSLPSTKQPTPTPQPVIQETTDTITIASWNLQIYGDAKTQDAQAMETIAQTIRNYDLIAVQEIRDEDQSSIQPLMDKINSGGPPTYLISIGPRAGRTDSKEQYAYIYRNSTIKPGETLTFKDDKDLFEREPYMQKFTANQFDFVLVNIHTKPDNAIQEIEDLQDVIDYTRDELKEPDMIILGDLNADCSYFPDGTLTVMRNQQYQWIIEDEEDTTTRDTQCAYDRIIIIKDATSNDYTGKYGIQEMTDTVSDHKPIWAQFYNNKDED